MPETQERKKYDNSSLMFKQNTIIHFENQDSEMFYVGDEVPPGIDVSKMNPEIFGPMGEEPEEFFDDYEAMKVRDLLDVARARGLELSSSRKPDVIALLREDDKAGGNDQ